MALLIGRLLLTGVLIAAVVTGAGALALLLQEGGAPAGYHHFLGEPAELRGVGGVVRGVQRFEPRAIVQLGIILLLATPVARVLLSLVAFLLQRDRLYVLVTTVVLGLLLFGLLGG